MVGESSQHLGARHTQKGSCSRCRGSDQHTPTTAPDCRPPRGQRVGPPGWELMVEG